MEAMCCNIAFFSGNFPGNRQQFAHVVDEKKDEFVLLKNALCSILPVSFCIIEKGDLTFDLHMAYRTIFHL